MPPRTDAEARADGDELAGTVLVTVDSLRADALAPRWAPTLSAMADRGVSFERAYAPGNWTPFSFPSILGGRAVFSDGPTVGLPDSPTLAESLQGAGVRTAGFNDANGFLTSHWGYDRGFERFETYTAEPSGVVGRFLAAHPTVQGWVDLATRPARRAAGALGAGRGDGAAHVPPVEREATSFLESVREPFFCWVHYMDAHTPYVPAPRHVRAVTDDRVGALRMLRAHLHAGLGWDVDDATLDRLWTLYRAAVHQVDASVGRLLDALETAGLRDRTMVVVAGDHGEEFAEHGHLAHYPKLYRELVHVPLLVDHPDAPARDVDAPVGLGTVPPTVCEALGVRPPDSFDGESLLPTARHGDPPDQSPITSVAVRGETVTEQPIPRRLDDGELLVSARDERWTYVHHTGSGRRELYDRAVDPEEQTDVWADHGGEAPVRRLQAAAEARAANAGGDPGDAGQSEAGEREATPESVERRLEVLGYR